MAVSDLDSEKIQSNRAFLERLWLLENDERPGFLIGYTGPKMRGGKPVISALFSTEGTETVLMRLTDPAKFLNAQLEEIEGQMAFRGDFVPSLCPTLGVVAIPSAFGCEVVWQEENFPAVRPAIQAPEEIDDLIMPGLRDGVLGQILDYTRYFRTHTQGAYPIKISDTQGPLDSASLIMGHNNFMLAMRTHPQQVHRLLQMITDLTIDYIRVQRAEADGDFVPSLHQPWIPDGWGVSVSDDDCVMISRRHFEEFAVPYFNQMSYAFGGLYHHSCGNWLHQMPALEQIDNLRGVEFGGSETPFAPVLERFGGKMVISCRVGLHRDVKFNGMADFVRQVISSRKTSRGLLINVDITNGIIDETWPETDLSEIYRLIEEN